MRLAGFETTVRALNDAGVRHLVAGGLAVNAHGYLRFTKDIDVVIQLIPDNVTRAFAPLSTLGYTPVAPVTAEQLAADRQQDRIDVEHLHMRLDEDGGQ